MKVPGKATVPSNMAMQNPKKYDDKKTSLATNIKGIIIEDKEDSPRKKAA